MNEFEIGDIVEITNSPTNKWGRVVEIPDANLFGFGYGSVKVRFLEDGSEVFLNTYLLKRWSVKDLIPSRCPHCASFWHKTSGFKEDYFDCKTCKKTKEDIVKEVSDKLK